MAYTDLFIDQGSDFNTVLDLSADDGSTLNIHGYSFASSIRKSYYSANATANMTIIILSDAGGNVSVGMNAATTANIAAGRYVYDVKMTDSSNITKRILEGIITINPQVTK